MNDFYTSNIMLLLSLTFKTSSQSSVLESYLLDASAQTLPSPSSLQQTPDSEESLRVPLYRAVVFRSYEIDDSVEERESELVKVGAGSEDGGAMKLSGSVEEEMGEDLSKDVFVEREEGSRGRHG